MTGSAAFFDLDHVLIPGSSLFLMARDLRSHDVYRAGDLMRTGARRTRIRMARESDRDLDAMRQEALSSITGRSQVEVKAWCRQLAAYEILPRVYPDMAKMIAAHCAAGDHTYLVTAAPLELAEPVARSLDMTRALGSIAETDVGGRYTGKLVGERLQGVARGAAIAAIADREDLDLRRCHVYSNTIDDKQLLTGVGHPHAVNPDLKLWKVAVRRGWAVHELRPIRRQILVGAPPFVPISALIGLGYAAGILRSRRR
ncbi:HAD superfamily hydrolase (TIGR01490 family) [Nakamurella sp. UYEF19]|uniref:HAD family hydrolase n=1 Tax=Nakamurella sp. UYEF19 TaxID=1756392 RepID=UPI00339A4BB6